MTPERWQQIKELLYQAQQLEAEERSAFLDRSCSSDDSLRQEVETLLVSSNEARSSFLESFPAQVTLMPGTRLGDYEVQKLLGAGGMGEVYRARDLRLRRDVAIKVLSSFLSSDKERLRRFEQEAQAAAALSHPNILAVFQMGTYRGAPYMVSELLEGETLRGQINRGPLAAQKATGYGVQIARGLAAAHEKGIVHRDLKPENLLVTKDGRLKILDFGLAKMTPAQRHAEHSAPTIGSETEPGVVMGTAGYMAPEQVRGESADHRADIFAFGAILYEMLTGKRAFQKPTSAETMSAILNEETPPVSQLVSGIPPALNRVVQRCLKKSPNERFHSASDLAFALEALSNTDTAPLSTPPPRKSRTKWLWATFAGVAITTALAVKVVMTPSTSAPMVESVRQLTNDGETKNGRLETDGARVYFNEGPSGSFRIAQVSAQGGQTSVVSTTLVNPQIAGLTADGSNMLVLIGAPTPTMEAIWSLPLPAGEARRLGDADVTDASLFPDGRLLYAVNSAAFSAERDGSNARKLEVELSIDDAVPTVSTDGRRMAFSSTDTQVHTWVINEAASNGTNAHPVLKSRHGLPDDICCMRWSYDGKYLLFDGWAEGRWDIWAFPDQKPLFGSPGQPTRLTNGPISYDSFVVSRDGKQILAIGTLRRGELLRYDPRVQQFLPFLGGISAYDLTFSHDGKWVSYVSYPEHTLWRSRADGSDRKQLTYPPVTVIFPRISPDGSKVAFTSHRKVYVVSMDGGTPQKVADSGVAPDWSPDGALLALTSAVPSEESTGKGRWQTRILNLRTRGASVVPDSQGIMGAWFASQDKLIAALEDQSKFLIFDLKTRKWTNLISSQDKFVSWAVSPDGRYLLYSTGGNNEGVFRLRLADHVVERIANLKNLHVIDDLWTGVQVSASPDGSFLVTRDIGTQEIYALDIKWP